MDLASDADYDPEHVVVGQVQAREVKLTDNITGVPGHTGARVEGRSHRLTTELERTVVT